MRPSASIFHWFVALPFALLVPLLRTADPAPSPPLTAYHDEESGRQVILREATPPSVTVEVRWTGDPGFPYRWMGKGTREENRITFTRIVGEDEASGPKYQAKVGARLEITFASGQDETIDEGILGEFRRLSEDKRRSLAVRELKMAEDSLTKHQRSTLGSKNPSLVEWNRRWPYLRSRWLGRQSLDPPRDPAALEKDADHWNVLVEATGQAIAFFSQAPPQVPMPPDGSGNYEDGFGGSIALRARADGSYRLGFSWQRGELEAMGSDFSVNLPAIEIKQVSGTADWSADFAPADPTEPEGETRARLRIVRSGSYLWVDASNAAYLTGPGWIDGIYRWGPIPAEE